jgi:hypothetical protein
MKPFSLVVLFLLGASCLEAQNHVPRGLIELQGAVSFNNSISTNIVSPVGLTGGYFKTQTLALRPSCGYFVTSAIECLLDLRYSFSFSEISYLGKSGPTIRHYECGLSVGVAYNYEVNEFFTPFVAAKIGVSWDRDLYDDMYDEGWGSKAVAFPDVIVGGRLFFSRQWALLLFGEYSKTAPIPNWEKNEALALGIGFAVFI